jgi:simple sugar transport system ATP-binding protein
MIAWNGCSLSRGTGAQHPWNAHTGKYTLIKAITGVFQLDNGVIVLDQRHVSFCSSQDARDSGIETIYQDLALGDNLSIGANIFLDREPGKKLFGSLPVIDRAKMSDAAKKTMETLEFHITRLDAPVATFSGGQRQAVAIGPANFSD